ncbi:MAG: glycosyltransferase family 39 protein [Candidatus Methanospirare jalkutatii]|nr:glycosyltransferase family 39 protein [Candidatus Methanospirare jalkutatii]
MDMRTWSKNREFLAVSTLTLAFFCLAVFNLGSLHIPDSCWQPSAFAHAVGLKWDEKIEVIVALNSTLNSTENAKNSTKNTLNGTSTTQMGAIYIFLSDANTTKFEIFGKGDGAQWRILHTYDNSKSVHFCNWERIALNTNASFLKFVFEPTDGKVGEMLVISPRGEKINASVCYFGVSSSRKNSKNESKEEWNLSGVADPRRLFDEQALDVPLTQESGAYFDEMYFVRTAWEHIHFKEPYEWTHPPLAKLIIAAGILLFGMNPFGWRIFGVIAATAMIPLVFVLAKRIFRSSAGAFFASFLLTFDFMHFTLARLATGEIFIMLFSLLMFFFAASFIFADKSMRIFGRNNSDFCLFLSTVSFGLCFAVKWTAFYGFISVIVLVLLTNFLRREQILNGFRGIFAGLLVSSAIYIASYIPYMLCGHSLFDVFLLQFTMFGYHAGLRATHPFASAWWSWPLMLKPLWLFVNPLDSKVSTVVLLGNPAIWWGGLAAITAISVSFVKTRRERRSADAGIEGMEFEGIEFEGKEREVKLFILLPFFLQWLPFAAVTRILFIYHFAPNVLFLVLALAYWLDALWRDSTASRGIVVAFLVLAASLFVLFYPVISGFPIEEAYRESLKWLPSWIF